MPKAKTTQAKPRAKAEAKPTETATRMLEEATSNTEGLTKMFGSYAEGGMQAMKDSASASTEFMRTLGARNMDFFTRTLEQSVEATQALTAATDPKSVMEIQTGFAKSFLSAYTKEVSAQAEYCMSAMRDAAKVFTPAAVK